VTSKIVEFQKAQNYIFGPVSPFFTTSSSPNTTQLTTLPKQIFYLQNKPSHAKNNPWKVHLHHKTHKNNQTTHQKHAFLGRFGTFSCQITPETQEYFTLRPLVVQLQAVVKTGSRKSISWPRSELTIPTDSLKTEHNRTTRHPPKNGGTWKKASNNQQGHCISWKKNEHTGSNSGHSGARNGKQNCGEN
jgi:hypothetical protein